MGLMADSPKRLVETGSSGRRAPGEELDSPFHGLQQGPKFARNDLIYQKVTDMIYIYLRQNLLHYHI